LPNSGLAGVASLPYWVREEEILLPNPERSGSLPTVSAFDILNSGETAAGLRGKAVFLGTTAAGLAAGLTTPNVAAAGPMAAVEFHARAYEALRSGLVYQTATPIVTLLFTLLLLAPPLFGRPLRNTRSAFAAGLLIVVPALASATILSAARLWIPPAAAMIGMADQHGVGVIGVERTIGFENQFETRQLGAALQPQRLVELRSLRRNDSD
jgi:CHASE2 domain-containing sensor protein